LKLRAKPLRYPFDISTYKLFSRGCSDMVARGLTVVPNYCDALRPTTAAGSGDRSSRLGQLFGLKLAPSLLQDFRLSFRRGDDLVPERREQWLNPLVEIRSEAPNRTSNSP